MKKLLYILLIFVSAQAFATHNRAGEITYRHISGFTYEITVTMYMKESSPATIQNVAIFWGDGNSDSLIVTSSLSLGNDVIKKEYISQHAYPGSNPIPYIISVEGPNRNAGIINIPNSVNTVFYLETELNINAFVGINNSPKFLNPAIGSACINNVYNYNSGSYDIDGDSLYFTIQESKREGGQPISGYIFPPASNSITVNPITGELVWDSPMALGEYNVVILTEEFRGGVKIGSVFRELQLTVYSPPCNTVEVETITNGKDDFLMFPNPTNNSVEISLDNNLLNYNLLITNSLGKQIFPKIEQQNGKIKINIEDYPIGIYVVCFSLEGKERIIQKLIKM